MSEPTLLSADLEQKARPPPQPLPLPFRFSSTLMCSTHSLGVLSDVTREKKTTWATSLAASPSEEIICNGPASGRKHLHLI